MCQRPPTISKITRRTVGHAFVELSVMQLQRSADIFNIKCFFPTVLISISEPLVFGCADGDDLKQMNSSFFSQ